MGSRKVNSFPSYKRIEHKAEGNAEMRKQVNVKKQAESSWKSDLTYSSNLIKFDRDIEEKQLIIGNWNLFCSMLELVGNKAK
jgi:hypothetical protein